MGAPLACSGRPQLATRTFVARLCARYFCCVLAYPGMTVNAQNAFPACRFGGRSEISTHWPTLLVVGAAHQAVNAFPSTAISKGDGR